MPESPPAETTGIYRNYAEVIAGGGIAAADAVRLEERRGSRLLYGAQAVADTLGGVVLAMLATVTVMQFFNWAFWPDGIVTDMTPEKLVSDP